MTLTRLKDTSRTSGITTALAVLALAGAALTGCADTEDDGQQAPSGSDETSSFSTDEEYQLAFAECMREQGIDMPDPGSDGTQLGAPAGEGFQEAALVCFDELGDPPSGSGGARPSEQQHEMFLEMAQCFRDHGFDVPDPARGETLTVPMDAPQDLFDECATAGETQ